MATSVITGTITDGAGAGVNNVTVVCTLKPYGFRISDSTAIAARQSTTTNSSGVYTFTLEETDNITPAGSWYEIEEQTPFASGGRRVWAIRVGADNATVAASLIPTAPTTSDNSYLTQAQGDSRYLTDADAVAGYQPLDSDLTAIAALTTTSYGRALLALANAAAADWITEAIGTAADSLITFSGAGVPAELTVAASRLIGKKSTGGLDDLTAAEVKVILALEDADIQELARDALGTALTAGSNITITPNDVANTITIAASVSGGDQPIVITATMLDPTGAAAMATTGTGGNARALMFDAASSEGAVGFGPLVPTGWATVNIDLWWVNAGAGAGDVRWEIYWADKAATNDVGTITGLGAQNVTAAAQYLVKVTRMATGQAVTPGELTMAQVYREAANAGDTLANDAGVLAVVITKAS